MSTDRPLLLRSVFIYAACLGLAAFLGYMLASPETRSTFYVIAGVLGIFMVPLLLRWHHVWLITVWNTQALLFFLPGRPSLALAMCGVSLLVSVLHHTLNREKQFIRVPEVARPLLFLAAVVLITSQLRGGIGLNVAGSDNVGGKRYIWLLGAVFGYFALAANRIPPRKVNLCVGLFFLSNVTAAIANLTSVVGPSAVYYVFLVFPPDNLFGVYDDPLSGTQSILRLGGLAAASTAVLSAMLALYGVAGTFDTRKLWRPAVFILAVVGCMLGGYRSILIGFLLTFALVFWFEGLMRTKFLPVMILLGLLCVCVVLPFANKMPLSVQRTLSFLPFVELDYSAEQSAKGSTDWRLDMWKEVLPEVPNYLMLGKGYAISASDLENFDAYSNTQSAAGSIRAGDYHSGPLSVIMPFGLMGVVGFLWFLGGSIKVLHYNYKFGSPAFRRVNTFLLASFMAKVVFFFLVFGSLYSDLAGFVGIIGLSISVNGGMMKPAPKARPAVIRFRKPQGLVSAHATR